MPRWDYKCGQCGNKTEWTGLHEDRPSRLKCDVCGAAQQLQPPTGTSFSITGWNAANGYGGKEKV